MDEIRWTEEQEEILGHDSTRHGRVLAGPGTGKSATVVALILRMLAEDETPNVRLLTFTRAATHELASKVSEHPTATVERPSTVHSFAISVLLRNDNVGDFPKPLRIADDWERKNIVNRTLGRRIGVRAPRIDRLFTELAAAWEIFEADENPRVDPAERARFLGGWREHRDVFGYTMLAELPYRLREALRDHPDLDGVDHYDMLVVDEYQDLNRCDLDLLRLVSERGSRIFGIGDDDQSIYSFRRAHPEGIRTFQEMYGESADYPLSVTHRCGSRIMEWAVHVIRGDTTRPAGRVDPTPAPGSPAGDVALLSFGGQRSEARGIARLVANLIEEEGVEPSSILILLRGDYNRSFSKPIKEELEAANIPVLDPNVVLEILAEPGNRLVLAMLRILVNNADSLAWATIFMLTPRVGPALETFLYEKANADRTTFGAVVLEGSEQGFEQAPSATRRRVTEVVGSVLSWLEEHPVPEETPEGGWSQWIINTAESAPGGVMTNDFKELLLEIDEVTEEDHGLGRFLGEITPLARDIAQSKAEGVRIMTMASSKGLTVDATIVAGLEEGLVPRPDADLNEERRLLYVAMTRAKRFLYGTWARQRRGPTARSGVENVSWRNHSSFLGGGPVGSQDGEAYIGARWTHLAD